MLQPFFNVWTLLSSVYVPLVRFFSCCTLKVLTIQPIWGPSSLKPFSLRKLQLCQCKFIYHKTWNSFKFTLLWDNKIICRLESFCVVSTQQWLFPRIMLCGWDFFISARHLFEIMFPYRCFPTSQSVLRWINFKGRFWKKNFGLR